MEKKKRDGITYKIKIKKSGTLSADYIKFKKELRGVQ